eukprot:TRINITY_DN49323_c0_g1_i1.p1 TRINITY_DN49323_c0_g1~~TRINITY_DN49323_c0_g1_i1.p1  ORF type:complete len:602 (-),score=107.96 TRINITY_DN49323_c0_g1_i1:207-2012(-)
MKGRIRQRNAAAVASGVVVGVLLLAVVGRVASTSGDIGKSNRLEAEDLALAPEARRLSVYPDDPILDKPYRTAGNRYMIFIHVILIGYMLLGLNTVCDVYFTGSLEVMVEQWDVKPDVAGATFMAAGGSAPELFTSLLGAIVTENDVGFGTIVGSAVFNVLFVIGLCGFMANEEISLTWWPLFRDCFYYILGLGLLALFASDEQIWLWEAIVLFVFYLIYCVIMYHNDRLEEALTDVVYNRAKKNVAPDIAGSSDGKDRDASEDSIEKINLPTPVVPQPSGLVSGGTGDLVELDRVPADPTNETSDGKPVRSSTPTESGGPKKLPQLTARVRVSVHASQGAVARHDERMRTLQGTMDLEQLALQTAGVGPPEGSETVEGEKEKEKENDNIEGEEDEDDGDILAKPDGGIDLVVWYFSLPILVPLYYTIPTPEADRHKFLISFCLSLVWIAIFSTFMVWWVETLGEVLHIPTFVMAVTVLAAGTSIPDAVSSVAVAKIGEGDMAISSSIGSNIFDILVGLPVPWILKTGIIEGGDYSVKIISPYMSFNVILLLFMVFSVIICIHVLGWKLNKMLGVMMGILYLMFLAVTITVELTDPRELQF